MNLIVNFTPTGMVPTRDLTPHVPLSVNEIVEDVHRAVELGITVVHLHARDEADGKPTHRAEVYGEIIGKIRSFAPELVIGVSLSGRETPDLERRAEPLQLDGDLRPDMGSLTLSSLNFSRQASLNAPDVVRSLATRMHERGVVPELEVFDLGMMNVARYLIARGVLRPPHYFNLLLGNIAGAQADPVHVGALLRELPEGALWSLAGLGDAQLPINALAIALGGGVRIGLEDNIWYDRGRTRLASNLELLQRAHRLAEIHERRVMSPGELRERLQLSSRMTAQRQA